jgi:hypothetical protein
MTDDSDMKPGIEIDWDVKFLYERNYEPTPNNPNRGNIVCL